MRIVERAFSEADRRALVNAGVHPVLARVYAARRIRSAAELGDDIVTTAGIFGTIVDEDEDEGTIMLEIAPGTRIKMMRAGIARRITEDDEFDEYDEADDDQVDDEDLGDEAPDVSSTNGDETAEGQTRP